VIGYYTAGTGVSGNLRDPFAFHGCYKVELPSLEQPDLVRLIRFDKAALGGLPAL
jgi:hypothetical protein